MVAALAQVSPAQDLQSAVDESDAPFDLTATSVEYDRVRQLYMARGDVRIVQPGRSLEADWVAFSNVSGRGIATGNVVVKEEGDTLYADVLEFEVDSSRGVVLNGRLDAAGSGFRISGETIRKTGAQTYEIEEGSFTTCRCPDDGTDPWTIRAERTDLELEGYGTARNTTFEVLGVPVLWLPWMIYPLNTDRHTGFLLPEAGDSKRSGFEVGLPFFWAVRPELNVLLTPSWLSKRGFMPEAEIEYVFGERSEGELRGAFVNDKSVDRDDPDTPFSPHRWMAEWIHVQDLTPDTRFVADARYFSENLYPFDFPGFSQLRVDRFVQSVGFVDTRFGERDRSFATAAVWWADDIQNPDNRDRDAYLLQRLPQLTLAATPRPLSVIHPRLVGALDVDYTHYTARERAQDVYPNAPVRGGDLFLDVGIDGIPNPKEQNRRGRDEFDANKDPGENDGVFEEGEALVDRGHRLLFNPRLSLPFRLFDALEVMPEVAWYGSAYQTREKGSELRSLVTGRLDLSTLLRRELTLPLGLGDAVHVAEPRLAWTTVSSQSQNDNPLFVPAPAVSQVRLRQLDLANVTRDPADRIDSSSTLTLGVGNRFYVDGEEGAPLRLLADVTLSGQYEFSGSELGWLVLDGTLNPVPGIRSRFSFGYDMDKSRIAESLLRVGWSSEKGHDLSVQYRYRRELPLFFESFRTERDRFGKVRDGFDRINQLALYTRWAITQSWAVTYAGRYSFQGSLNLNNEVGVEYISRCRCWAVRVAFQNDRSRGVDVNLEYALIGLGDDVIRPFSR